MEKKINLTKTEILLQTKNFALVLLGTIILGFGCAIFVVPFQLVTGGVTGISIIVNSLFNIETVCLPIIGELPFIDVIIAVITWGLFLLGMMFLGWDFASKTLVSSLVYPIAISVFSRLVSPDVMQGVFDLSLSPHADISLIISALFGGLCIGTGCAITFLGGGSTGGVDIIAFIICKFAKKWKSSTLIFVIDAATVVVGLFVIGDLILTLLGVVSAWLCAMVIDKIFLGREQAFTAQIVSEKAEEINLAIRTDVRRTTTIFCATGGFSGQGKTVLSVTFSMREYASLMQVIKRIDPTAFVSITRAHEINGEGWTYGTHD